jgi:hypothetical protein
MKKLLMMMILIGGLLYLSGCATTEKTYYSRGKGEPVIDINSGRTEIEIASEKIIDNMMDAIHELDYKKFSKDFSDDLKKKINEKKFKQVFGAMNENFGPVSKKLYLGNLKKGPLVIYIWKANFKKVASDNQMLLRLIMDDSTTKPKIYGFDVGLM